MMMLDRKFHQSVMTNKKSYLAPPTLIQTTKILTYFATSLNFFVYI